MSEKRIITISLRYVLLVFIIILAIFYHFNCSKNETGSEKDATDSVNPKTQTKDNAANAKISKLTPQDAEKTLMRFPPNFAVNCDTIMWQKSRIIRHFSIDTTLQRRTETLVRRAKTKYGAAVAINPKTGQVLALVSQADAGAPKVADNLCLSNIFPAASIIKTVTAEAAFDNIADISGAAKMNWTGKSTTLYKNQFFSKEKDSSANITSFAEAFARSNNPVFAKLAVHNLGREKLAKSAQRFGWNSKIPFALPCAVSFFPETTDENVNDTINLAELGSGFNDETTLTPLLGGLIAAAVINRGSMMTPTLIDSISDMSGKKLFTNKPKKWKNGTAADIADSLKNLMRETTKIGSARKAFNDMERFAGEDIIFGGKTGTKDSDHGRNEWFIGFAQDKKNEIAVATSICFVQFPRFVLRPSQVSADIMLDYLQKTRKQIKDKENKLDK